MWTLLAVGFCFYNPEENRAHLGMIALFVFLFAAFYSLGEGPVPLTYSIEGLLTFPQRNWYGWAVAMCLFWTTVLSISFPRFLVKFTPTGAFEFNA